MHDPSSTADGLPATFTKPFLAQDLYKIFVRST
jgi:hypothetical protein